MTDIMKRILLPLAVLLVAAGCDRFTVGTYQDNLQMAAQEDQPDSLLFSISLDYATGGMPKAALEAMNRSIILQAFDLETLDAPLEEIAVTYRENLVDEYLNDFDPQTPFFSWEDNIQGEFLPDWKGWKNYLLQYYCFRGGAHGIQTVSYLVFDAKTGAQLHEADIFKEGFQEPITELLRASVLDEFSYEPQLQELLDLEAVVPNGNFVADAEGIMWAYQPYEVGPHSLGVVSATLYWEDLKPFLK